MTTAIRSPSNTPIVWVARKVNDFSRIQSTAIAYVRAVVIAIKWSAVKIRQHLVNKHDGSAVVVAPAAYFTKNAKCVQGILYFVAEDFVKDFFY